MSLLAGLVLEDGRRWGTVALPWQWMDVRAVVEPEPGSPRRHFWLRARGMSKTADAAALLLALLLTEAPARSRSFVYAVDESQAGLVLDSIVGFVQRSGLAELVEIGARSVTCRESGATLTIESSDSASAFGSRPWMTVVDEHCQWPDTRNHRRLWGALISAQGKVAGSRLLVMSSPGSPAHPSFKHWETAEGSPHWRTSLTPGPAPWWSEDDVLAAAEQLTPTEYRRYLLCEWAEADDSLATADDVAACTGTYRVQEPRPGVRYTMALDVGTRRDSTVLTVGHLETGQGGRRVVIDRVYRWTGSRKTPVSLIDVEEALLAAWRAYGRPRLLFDFHQAAQLTERLRRAGVRTEEFVFSVAGVNRLARALFGALRDRAILLPADPALIAELGTVRLVETGPGLVRLDHRSGQHDDQAVACAILVASLLDRPSGTMRVHVAERPQPPTQLFRRRDSNSSGAPVPIVGPDGQRPKPPPGQTVRLGNFRVDRRFYTPPGADRR
jgi:hypothetical protein